MGLRYQTQVNRLGHKYVLPTELSYWPFPCFKISELNTHWTRCGALIQIKLLHFLLSQKRARGTQIPPVLKFLPCNQWWAPSQAQGSCHSHSNPMAVRTFVISFLQNRKMRSRGTDHCRLGGLGHYSKEKGAVETKPR